MKDVSSACNIQSLERVVLTAVLNCCYSFGQYQELKICHYEILYKVDNLRNLLSVTTWDHFGPERNLFN